MNSIINAFIQHKAMKLHKNWILLATCTIILAVASYATIEQTAKQIQAEVNLQQVGLSPPKSLKYGDKISNKKQSKEVLFLPNAPTLNNNHANNNTLLSTRKHSLSPDRSHSRVEHQPQISRRYDSQQSQLDVHADIPIVYKNYQVLNKPTTASAGHQRAVVSNRSHSKPTLTEAKQGQQSQLPKPNYHNFNVESEKAFPKKKPTKTHNKSRQRVLPTTSHAIASMKVHQSHLSANNSNVRTQRPKHSSSSNSTIIKHYQSNQRNQNNSNININSQPLLPSSNAVAVSGLQSKTESSSNRQAGSIPRNQHAHSNSRNKNIRSKNVRKAITNASSDTISSLTSTPKTTATTKTATLPPPFRLPTSLNIFTPEFWEFLFPTSNPFARLQPTTARVATTTGKPPKKYQTPMQISTKEAKLSLVKPNATSQPRITAKKSIAASNYKSNNNALNKDEGPFRIALPTSNLLTSKRETNEEGNKGVRNEENEIRNLRERFDCPRESEVRFQLFPKICKIDADCKVWNREEICCDIFGAKSCITGIPKPLEETSHAPILGVIPRKCPSRPLAELWWEVKECETDMDCWPRVCCPDGRRRYCRTSQPELNTVPVPVQRSFNYLTDYLECTAPPPAIFDLHPKSCTSTLDCFPNVCCQEAGLRHCRPPKKSVLTMLANVFNVDFVKRLTQNIVIK